MEFPFLFWQQFCRASEKKKQRGFLLRPILRVHFSFSLYLHSLLSSKSNLVYSNETSKPIGFCCSFKETNPN